jgi:DNA polymerase-1
MFAFDLSVPAGKFVEDEREARELIPYLLQRSQERGGLGIDSETTGVNKFKDVVLIWSISDGIGRWTLPSAFLQMFKAPLLENPNVDFDGTNIVFDMHMFANSGVDLSKARSLRCTKVQSWLRNENNLGRHGLKDTIKDHFKRETPSFESIFGKLPPKRNGVQSVTVGDLIRTALADPIRRQVAADYASLDAYNSTSMREHFDKLLTEIELYPGYTMRDFFYAVEVPFTKVLYKMERRGLTVDAGYLRGLQGPMEREMENIEREFARAASQTEPRLVNLNSVNDVRWFFFDLLGKTPTKMTDGGKTGIKKPSVDAEVLEDWAGEGDAWAQLLMKYRSISKIHGTYVVGLQEWLDPLCRIHTSLNQTGTVTGRLSSSEPNLQNIPRISEDQFKIREAFIPSERMRLIVADYAQLEMRLMAHFSGDVKMIEAIKKGTDLHCLTVSEMEGIPYDDVAAAVKAEKAHKAGKLNRELTEREQELLLKRQNAKATGFGIIYGIGGPRLAAQLTRTTGKFISPQEGNQLIQKWLNVFPGVRKYIEDRKSFVWKTGFVQTIMGRFRRFGDLRGMSKMDAAMCERQAVNAIVQGTAADVAKMAMLKAEHDPELARLGAQLLLQVHDELIFECPDDDETVAAVKNRVKQIMEDPFGVPLMVPLPAEAGQGYSWATAK